MNNISDKYLNCKPYNYQLYTTYKLVNCNHFKVPHNYTNTIEKEGVSSFYHIYYPERNNIAHLFRISNRDNNKSLINVYFDYKKESAPIDNIYKKLSQKVQVAIIQYIQNYLLRTYCSNYLLNKFNNTDFNIEMNQYLAYLDLQYISNLSELIRKCLRNYYEKKFTTKENMINDAIKMGFIDNTYKKLDGVRDTIEHLNKNFDYKENKFGKDLLEHNIVFQLENSSDNCPFVKEDEILNLIDTFLNNFANIDLCIDINEKEILILKNSEKYINVNIKNSYKTYLHEELPSPYDGYLYKDTFEALSKGINNKLKELGRNENFKYLLDKLKILKDNNVISDSDCAFISLLRKARNLNSHAGDKQELQNLENEFNLKNYNIFSLYMKLKAPITNIFIKDIVASSNQH